jgi:4-diphosphocytidyl-2-C-methyl-D-erythritol kinase
MLSPFVARVPLLLALSARVSQRLVRMTALTGNWEATLFSPAKINLFTRVLGKDSETGLHEVASLAQTVGYGDELRLARLPADRNAAAGVVRPSRTKEAIKQHCELTISPTIAAIPSDESNMVVRALALFRTKLAQRDGGSLDVPRFRAHLLKRVPLDAGLCGAASNAASALWGANVLCGSPASTGELVEWSRELGADVASFLAGGGSTYCTGRAVFHKPEDVAALPPLANLAGVQRGRDGDGGNRAAGVGLFLIVPLDVQLSTPQLFRGLADEQYQYLSDADPADLCAAAAAAAGGACDSAGGSTSLQGVGTPVNDLERVALECSEELRAVKRELMEKEGFQTVALSGAGPALFAVGTPRDASAEAFSERFVRDCAQGAKVNVLVKPVGFLQRSEEDWYTDPTM